MGDAKPLERRGRIGQNRVDADAQLVGAFLRFAAEIDGDDAEFETLGRHRTHEPDFAAIGGDHCAGRVIAVTGCDLDHFAETCSRYVTPARRPLLSEASRALANKHDLALHDAGEVIFDRGMNVGDIERHSQAAREGIEVAQVDFALARHFQLPFEASGELAHGYGDEDEQDEVDDLLRVLDAKAVKRLIEKERRGEHAANGRNDRRDDSPAGGRDHHRDQEHHGAVRQVYSPDEAEKHRGQDGDETQRHEDAGELFPKEVEFQRVMHRHDGP